MNERNITQYLSIRYGFLCQNPKPFVEYFIIFASLILRMSLHQPHTVFAVFGYPRVAETFDLQFKPSIKSTMLAVQG